MLVRFALLGTLALPAAAGAEVLSAPVSPFDYSVKRPAPPPSAHKVPRGLARAARYLFHHMDGHGPIKPLQPVDGIGRTDTLETGDVLVWKVPW